MRICLVNPYYDRRPASLLEVTGRYRHVEALSAALARRNHEVIVVQPFHDERVEHRNAVEYRYARTPRRSAPRLAGGLLGVDFLVRSNLKRMMEVAKDARPDAVHMFGLPLLQPLLELGAWCEATGRPLTASFHGGTPRREPWLKGLQHQILKRCSAAFFTTLTHARPWLGPALLREDQIVPCMEVSSSFAPADREQARARTKMRGNPVFAWNARLQARKDPLTVLRGFSLIRRTWREARLHMIYYTNELERPIREMIGSDPHLIGAVELRGAITPPAVEEFLNSADFLVQGSLREVAGYSVLEAMSCGVIPVVTDIPSFRAMTADGAFGVLFPIGDHRSMAEQTLAYDLRNLATLSQNVRDRFVQVLGYDAMARTYEDVFKAKASRPVPLAHAP